MAILLYEYRTKHNLTLRDLERATGISGAQLSRIENGKSDPTHATMCKIAYAMKENPWDIFPCDEI